MKLTKAFTCVLPGEIYPVELAAGEDCPEEYENSAREQGCLGKPAPAVSAPASAPKSPARGPSSAAKPAAEAEPVAQSDPAAGNKDQH